MTEAGIEPAPFTCSSLGFASLVATLTFYTKGYILPLHV